MIKSDAKLIKRFDNKNQSTELIRIGFEHKCCRCNLIKQNESIYEYNGEPFLNFLNNIENKIDCHLGSTNQMNCCCTSNEAIEMKFMKFTYITPVVRHKQKRSI